MKKSRGQYSLRTSSFYQQKHPQVKYLPRQNLLALYFSFRPLTNVDRHLKDIHLGGKKVICKKYKITGYLWEMSLTVFLFVVMLITSHNFTYSSLCAHFNVYFYEYFLIFKGLFEIFGSFSMPVKFISCCNQVWNEAILAEHSSYCMSAILHALLKVKG